MKHLRYDVGLDALEAAQQLLVVRERQTGVQAVDDVDLGRRIVHPHLELAPRLFERIVCAPGSPSFELRERAEEARRDADVRDLDAHVAVEVRAVAVAPLAHLVARAADRDPVGLTKERDAVVEREALAARRPSRAMVSRCRHASLDGATPASSSRACRRRSVATKTGA